MLLLSRAMTRRRLKRTESSAIGRAASVATTPAATEYPKVSAVAANSEAGGRVLLPPWTIR